MQEKEPLNKRKIVLMMKSPVIFDTHLFQKTESRLASNPKVKKLNVNILNKKHIDTKH